MCLQVAMASGAEILLHELIKQPAFKQQAEEASRLLEPLLEELQHAYTVRSMPADAPPNPHNRYLDFIKERGVSDYRGWVLIHRRYTDGCYMKRPATGLYERGYRLVPGAFAISSSYRRCVQIIVY